MQWKFWRFFQLSFVLFSNVLFSVPLHAGNTNATQITNITLTQTGVLSRTLEAATVMTDGLYFSCLGTAAIYAYDCTTNAATLTLTVNTINWATTKYMKFYVSGGSGAIIPASENIDGDAGTYTPVANGTYTVTFYLDELLDESGYAGTITTDAEQVTLYVAQVDDATETDPDDATDKASLVLNYDSVANTSPSIPTLGSLPGVGFYVEAGDGKINVAPFTETCTAPCNTQVYVSSTLTTPNIFTAANIGTGDTKVAIIENPNTLTRITGLSNGTAYNFYYCEADLASNVHVAGCIASGALTPGEVVGVFSNSLSCISASLNGPRFDRWPEWLVWLALLVTGWVAWRHTPGKERQRAI